MEVAPGLLAPEFGDAQVVGNVDPLGRDLKRPLAGHEHGRKPLWKEGHVDPDHRLRMLGQDGPRFREIQTVRVDVAGELAPIRGAKDDRLGPEERAALEAAMNDALVVRHRDAGGNQGKGQNDTAFMADRPESP
jgi:hypothetical protein